MIKKFWTLMVLTLCIGTSAFAMFTDSRNSNVTLDIQGCTDFNACNYDADATEDDGSCTYASLYYADADGDGFGDASNSTEDCSQPVGYVSDDTDCNDNEAAISPAATEVCNEWDDNCDGEVDEYVVLTFYADLDMDGFGDLNSTTYACSVPADYVVNSDDCDDASVTYLDADGDGEGSMDVAACGVYNSLDCDDNNASANSLATEICGDDIDQDCSGSDLACPISGCMDVAACNFNALASLDDASCAYPTAFYADVDGDGFGDNNNVLSACSVPVGYVDNDVDCNDNEIWFLDADGDGFGGELFDGCGVTNNADCNDLDALISPNATEICNELDDNCDGESDEFVLVEFYADLDEDGFGDANNTIFGCSAPIGFVANAEDCDDGMVTYLDADQDGVGTGAPEACGVSLYNNDCDDNNAELFPGNTESCNGLDDNCDEIIDEGALSTLYADLDGDNFGDANNSMEGCLSLNPGYVLDATDCNDNAFTYADQDGDGWGAGAPIACGTSASNEDCDDENAALYPTAAEFCNGIDDNCNSQVDEGVLTTFFWDGDADGFGAADSTIQACTLVTGFVENADDCDDTQLTYADMDADGFGAGEAIACGTSTNNLDCDDNNNAIFPNNPEVCNSIDDNCDGEVDEFVLNTYYADADGDGFGDANATTFACVQEPGYVSNMDDCDDAQVTYTDVDNDGFGTGDAIACGTALNYTDCDDNNAGVSPSAIEVCNDIDDNCNIEVDEFVLITFYADNDADGYGDVSVTAYACSAPLGFVSNGDDCDDTQILYEDVDGDGYGNNNVVACGVVTNSDCNDANDAINPGLTEVCGNAVDENCDGNINENCPVDMDGDGFDNIVDCDDANPAINPDAQEVCNNLDDNCNTAVDENLMYTIYFYDQDFDNYGSSVYDTLCYNPGIGYTTQVEDCNDDDANINPGMTEVFNYIDDNCNGIVDDNFVDTDNDGIENGVDTDDDNDGLLDEIEDDFNGDGITGDDCDGDGVPNVLDADDCEIFIPEGFSPNSDGVNDAFQLQQLPYGAVVDIEIYNRWGGLVFESDNYQNDWTGVNIDGNDLPAGSYIYVIRIANKSLEYTNNLTLWR
jgi:gliding motility-associated-like protein